MREAQSAEKRNSLVEAYQTYVHYVVGKLVRSMGLPTSAVEDLRAAGYLGLLEAADRFDENSGVEFKNYAYLRVRGAIIDSIRNQYGNSARAYRYARALRGMQELRETELATGINQTPDPNKAERLAKVLEYASKGALAFRLSMCEAEEEVSEVKDESPSPEDRLSNIQESKLIRKLVATLPRKERLIIEGYYFNEKSFKKLANSKVGLSKSWTSRLHGRALTKLKQLYLESFNEETHKANPPSTTEPKRGVSRRDRSSAKRKRRK